MRWSVWYKTARLRWRLSPMRARVLSARRLLRAFFARVSHPYVAFSGGKDSLVVLDLALQLSPTVQVVWSDEDWLPPGTAEFIETIEGHYGIRIIRARERHGAKEFHALYGVWPVCSAPRPVDFEADTWGEVMEHFGFGGVILGLRRGESAGRHFALRRPLRQCKGDGLWHVAPIYDWSCDEVWSYIAGNDLPVHPAYREMIEAGVEPEHARIGPLTAVRVYQYGMLAFVKQQWPDLWNRFRADNPMVEGEG